MWISELGIHYKLGIDGLNVFMIGLTTLLFAAAVIAANLREWDRPRLFYFNFMLAESAVLGALLAQDLALFVAFFDLMLIPFYFLIGAWGTGARTRQSDDQAGHLHARRLVADARRGRSPPGVLAAQQGGGHITFVLSGAAAAAAQPRLAGLDLLVLRRGVPREDAGVPAARLDARRLQGDADRGADGLLGRALEGRRVRLPAHRAAAVTRRRRRIFRR